MTKKYKPKQPDNTSPDKDLVVRSMLHESMAGDIMGIAELQDYPELKGMDDRDVAILCMTAAGMSQSFIARALGIKQPSVHERLTRADPDRRFTLSPKAKKAFMTRFAETRGIEALASITPEKLESASATELMRIAKDAVNVSQQLNQSKHKDISANKLDHMLALIEADGVEEAEIEEVE